MTPAEQKTVDEILTGGLRAISKAIEAEGIAGCTGFVIAANLGLDGILVSGVSKSQEGESLVRLGLDCSMAIGAWAEGILTRIEREAKAAAASAPAIVVPK